MRCTVQYGCHVVLLRDMLRVAAALLILGHVAAESCPRCSVTLYHTKHGDHACQPDVDFGCYPGMNMMWIRTAAQCGGFFRCGAGQAATRCGSRYFRPAVGQDRLNCSCVDKKRPPDALEESERPAAGCGVQTGTDKMGGVSSAYRRLPQPASEDTSVKCCRNKPTFGGLIDWCAVARRP